MHRLAVSRLPTVKRVERTVAPKVPREHGVAVDSAAGNAVRYDVVAHTVQRNTDEAIAVPSAQDPLTPGLVSIDDAGRHAVVMCAQSAHGDPSLVVVDFEARTTEVVRSFQGPGWMCGAVVATGAIVVCEQRLGERPRFSIVVVDEGASRVVWSIEAMCTPCIPALIDDDVLACVVCVSPDPLTLTGPSSLVALELRSGAMSVLAPASGARVRVEHTGEDTVVVVEGGRERVCVVLEPKG